MNGKCFLGGLILLLATMTAHGDDAKKPFRIAIWLVPAQGQQRQLQQVIATLAARHSSSANYAPVFQPHATLCTGELKGEDIAKELHELFNQVDAFADMHNEVHLAANSNPRIDQRRKHWWQFLFLRLNNQGAPAEAVDAEKAKAAFPAISTNLTVPTDSENSQVHMLHISLMYSGVEDAFPDIKKEVETKYILPNQLVFDSIQVVTPRSGDWQDIVKEHADGKWDVIYTKKLKPLAPSKSLRH